ncbi:AAA family ATPase [candidate division WOR-3 bacterium]|nr:AAA family ATPase [candidate division WOR-3 bacterium]
MNYEAFYGLNKEPFRDIPDPNLFYSGPEHTRALVKLLHVIKKSRALGLLTGDVGCGKTTIIRKIFAELDEDEDYSGNLMTLTQPDFSAIWFNKKLGELLGLRLDSKGRTEMKLELIGELERRHKANKKTVILIDEANNITNPEVMEEIRGFLNLELQGYRLVTIILSGMGDMYEKVKDNVSLRQRVSTVVSLPPLTLTSTREYINYRLEQAGATGRIFSDESYKLIYDFTSGVPRLINVICDNALLEGALLKKKVLEESVIKRVGEELMLNRDR